MRMLIDVVLLSINRQGPGVGSSALVRAETPQKAAASRNKKPRIKQCQAIVANMCEEPEEHGPARGRDAANVEAEAGPRRPQQRGKQRRQVHAEQREHALANAHQGQAPKRVLPARERAVGDAASKRNSPGTSPRSSIDSR